MPRRQMDLLSMHTGIASRSRTPNPLRPVSEQGLCFDGLYLLAIAAVVEGEHRVVRFVGRAAEPVRDDDDTVPAVDGPQHRAQHADIRLAARDHERVDAAPAQAFVELRLDPG